MKLCHLHLVVCLVLMVIISKSTVTAFEDDALAYERDGFHSMDSIESSSERGLISKMIERGKLIVKSLPRTFKLAGRVFNWVPKPETIFRVSKQALIGLPQEAIAYAVNSMCE